MYSQQSGGVNTKNVRVVDMRSDTLSVPTPEMRKAMFEAEIGDDVYGEDPTVIELELKSAKLLGKEAALFVPSGTMGNLLAVMTHCNGRGSEAVVGDNAHIFLYEQGGAAHLAGVLINTIKNNADGTFCLNQLQRKFRGYDNHEPITSLVTVENTHNMCGGKVLPLEFLEAVSKICKEKSAQLHMDGARLFNAAEYLKVPVSRVVRDVDSVCFCLSKGLSCPVGSMLVGTSAFIKTARRSRKALGGGMRQVGFLAAAGIYALNNVVPTLPEDHKKARKIAEAIHALNSPILKVDIENVQTNILMLHLTSEKMKSDQFSKRLLTVTDTEMADGIVDANGLGICLKLSSRDWSFARIVTYVQITDELVNLAIKKLTYVIKEFEATL